MERPQTPPQPEYPRSKAEAGAGAGAGAGLSDPEALKQLRKLHDAAKLAAVSKFRCEVCEGVHDLRNGVVIVARKNILLGVCMGCAPRTRVVMAPMKNGEGFHIGVESDPTQRIVIPAVSLSEIREVETSKISEQRAERTPLGDDDV